MEVTGKTIRFPNTLWVQHGGVKVKNEGETVAVEAVDEDSYLKVFNHFGRVLKLYTFENKEWVDTATGAAPIALDESLVGHVPAALHTSSTKPAVRVKAPPKNPVAKSSAAKPASKDAAKTAAKRETLVTKTSKGAAKSPGKKAAKKPAKGVQAKTAAKRKT